MLKLHRTIQISLNPKTPLIQIPHLVLLNRLLHRIIKQLKQPLSPKWKRPLILKPSQSPLPPRLLIRIPKHIL